MITKTLSYFEPVFDSDENNQTSSEYFDMETCLNAARQNIDGGLVCAILIEGPGETHLWDAKTGRWS